METISRLFRNPYQRFDRSGPAISGASRDNPYNDPAPLAACRVGDLRRLEREIEKDSSIVNRDYRSGKTGNTVSLLYIAVIGRYVELARLLIDKGADVNYALKKGGFTALTYAAQIGFIEIVQLLIDNGANIDQAGNDGATPLYYAAQEGHTEIVKLLLAYDADPEKEWKMFSIGRMSFTKSPLFAAQILSGDVEAAQMIATAIKERKINLSGEFPPLLAGQHASYGTIR